MTEAHGYLKQLLANLKALREKAGLSEAALEEKLILGPGWVRRFEQGETIPSIDMLLAILHETGANLRGQRNPASLSMNAFRLARGFVYAELWSAKPVLSAPRELYLRSSRRQLTGVLKASPRLIHTMPCGFSFGRNPRNTRSRNAR